MGVGLQLFVNCRSSFVQVYIVVTPASLFMECSVDSEQR